MCGFQDYFLGDHLAEAHDMSLDAYLESFPKAATVAQEVLDSLAERSKGIQRSHPPVPTELYTELLGFKVRVNADVDPLACLPMPHEYRFPSHGDLAVDLQEAAVSFLRGRHLYIHGMPGSGKDAFVHAMSALLRRPAIIKTVTPTTDVEAWLYVRSFDQEGTRWETQELFRALTEGYTCPNSKRVLPYIILISDFDRATKSQAEFLRLIIDSISGRVQGPGGKVFSVVPGTQIIVTANTSGGGDVRGRMVSANVIDGSIMDRFERKIQFHWMEWDDEEPICKAKFPILFERCPDSFRQVGKSTTSLRSSIAKDELYAEFSHRAVCSWLGHMEDIVVLTKEVPKDLVKRGARTWLDGMPDEETRLAAQKLIDAYVKSGVIGTERDSSGDRKGPLAEGF